MGQVTRLIPHGRFGHDREVQPSTVIATFSHFLLIASFLTLAFILATRKND
jgi:hypothetical protein